MRHIEESGFAAFLVRIVPYPPFEAAASWMRLYGMKKQAISPLSQPISSRSANRTARHVE